MTDALATVRRLLTIREQQALAACYSDGHDAVTAGRLLGVSPDRVRKAILRASDKLAAAGLPRPRPYGRGSRRELRRIMPGIPW
jgi:DNA-directed RNA polymerase specialized sigma24 family protein